MSEIRRVAVIGAGVMGSGIACHLANAGVPSLLYDIVPAGQADRSALARKAIESATRTTPPPLFRPAATALITACNLEDDGGLLASCDWIVEVVVERLDVKRKVYEWIAKNRRDDAIVSSNTSGIPLARMAENMPPAMRRQFLVTHFFNPVRYMRLLEIVAGPETDAAIVDRVSAFGSRVLGKGVVFGKDTPGFVANRIGTFGMAAVFRAMADLGMSIEVVDAVFGTAMGRPKSAVFRTADLVGLDTMADVLGNLRESLPHDEEREAFQAPAALRTLLDSKRLGEKSGAGFYKKVKEGGRSEILVLDLATGEYRAQRKVRFDSIGKAKRADRLQDKLKALVSGSDPAAALAWRVTADTLAYAARRIPEIADDVVNVDRALRWGFGWDFGPFETWDALGVRAIAERMTAEGREIPPWVKGMLAAGRETFYAREADGTLTHWRHEGGAAPVPFSPGEIHLPELRARGQEIERTASASLYDLGEGILGLEFHTKLNALDDLVVATTLKALDRLDSGPWEALVVGNQDPKAFCAGANLLMILMGAVQGQWKEIERQIGALQQLLMRAKYHPKPVVMAPHDLTLGGGAEIAMHGAATVAAGELYMGLVEVAVGLIPGTGGCKELLVRALGDVPQDVEYDPNPFVQKVFERIGLAKVSSSAEEARDWGYLRPTDRVVLNADSLISEARRTAIGLAGGGYVAPRPRTVKLPGPTGRAAIELYLYQMHEGGYATGHDLVVGKKLAWVLTGGDIPWATVRTEQDLLDLEREAFLSLAGTKESQARMQHMLETGKPLRN